MKKNAWIYYPFTHVYQKWRSYDVCFLRYKAWWTEFFVILDDFLPFHLPDSPENQYFEKMKMPGDIITLHMCTKNDNHMIYGTWDMECDRHSFLSILTIFCIFPPKKSGKSTSSKNFKKRPADIIILHMCTIITNHMMYGSWDMEHYRQCFVILGHLLPFYPQTTRKIKI